MAESKDSFNVDLGSLAITNTNYSFGDQDFQEDAHTAINRDVFQYLVCELFSLEKVEEKGQICVMLPEATMKLPRSKHIPVLKEKTKWQKFAEEKGIKNTKKSYMVFDEDTNKYIPRYGPNSKKNTTPSKNWVVEMN